jgi:hypothetical protein
MQRPLSADERMALMEQGGRDMYPVNSLDDAAALIEATAAVPAHVPSAVGRIAERLREKGSALAGSAILTLEPLVARLRSQPRARHLMEKLPPADGLVLITDRETCAVAGCHGTLFPASHKSSERCAYPAVYTKTGVVQAKHLSKRCDCCNATHYLSYATGGVRLAKDDLQPYEGCTAARFVHFTNEVVWETALLEEYGNELLHAHVPAYAFERIYAATHHVRLPSGWRKLMKHAWYGLELLRRLSNVGIPLPAAPYSTEKGIDATILEHFDTLKHAFVTRWAKGHRQVCRSPSKCNCYMVDGHMKTKRLTCGNRMARVIDAGKLGKMVLPCDNTPLRTSRWCV